MICLLLMQPDIKLQMSWREPVASGTRPTHSARLMNITPLIFHTVHGVSIAFCTRDAKMLTTEVCHKTCS